MTIVPSIDNVDITSSPFSPDNVVSSSSSSRVPAEGVQIGCDGLDVSIRLTIVPSIDNVDITSIPLSPDNVVSSSSSSRAPVSRNVARRSRGTWSNNRSTESRRRTCSLDNISFKVVSDNTEGIVSDHSPGLLKLN